MDWKQMIAKIKDIDLSKPEQISMLQKLPTALQQLVDENQSLRADLERFRGYVENASDTIVDMDLQGKITYTNSNWVRNLGYKPEEVINKRIFESMFHPEDAARASAYLQKAIDTKTIQT
jgi:PAS domain-containing protein